MNWGQIQGQPQAVTLLRRALVTQRVVQGYLFHGPTGVGKALTAKIFAQAILNNNHGQSLDLLWVEPTFRKGKQFLTRSEAEQEGLEIKGLPEVRLDQIRTVGQYLSRSSLQAPRLVVVIEGAETMAEVAANGLLKTLEQPGNGVIVLLASSPDQLLSTIRSRCQPIPFYRLEDQVLARLLPPEYPPELLPLAQGSVGEALRILKFYAKMPDGLLKSFDPWPRDPLAALHLAREIEHCLDLDTQRWLIDYLQLQLWQQGESTHLKALEQLRQRLGHYIQPRLAWEVALLPPLRST